MPEDKEGLLQKIKGILEEYADLREEQNSLQCACEIIRDVKEAGYISPEECKQCQTRQTESERMLNREACFDEKRLRSEIQDWKDRYYEIGGK